MAAPAQVPQAPLSLGRLGPALRQLAAAQGSWPPHPPREVARPAQAGASIEAGAQVADRVVDAGADLVVVGGAGPTGPALVALAALLSLEPVTAVGTTGAPDWAALVATVRTGLRAVRPHLADLRALLRAAGADEVAGLTGLVTQCAVRRTPVLLSGSPPAAAAAVAADRLVPGVTRWLIAGCSPAGGAAALALSSLGLEPLLDLRLAAPAGAELALQVLVTGVHLADPAEPAAGQPAGQPPGPTAGQPPGLTEPAAGG